MVRAVLFCAHNSAHLVLCSENGRCFMCLGSRWRLSEGMLPAAGEWGW